jgi:alcohol dehydrogenase
VRSLIFIRPGVLEWQERPDPRIEGDGAALVRPIAATTCDLDQLVIRGQAPFEGPFAIGHECLAEVVDLGDAVSELEPGQRVAVPYHICCGRCRRCRAGQTAHCEEVPYGAMFGLPVAEDWGGLFSDLVRVPFAEAMLTPVDTDVDARAAVSAGDNLALALECLQQHLAEADRARVLILGTLSIGLYAVDLARALGAERVVYVDRSAANRAQAEALGAEALAEPPEQGEAVFDLAIDASANGQWLRQTLQLLEPEGAYECPSIYFDDVALPLFPMAIRGVRFHTGRGNAAPHIPRLLELIATRAIRPQDVVSEVVDWDDAPAALADPSMKPLITRAPG